MTIITYEKISISSVLEGGVLLFVSKFLSVS